MCSRLICPGHSSSRVNLTSSTITLHGNLLFDQNILFKLLIIDMLDDSLIISSSQLYMITFYKWRSIIIKTTKRTSSKTFRCRVSEESTESLSKLTFVHRIQNMFVCLIAWYTHCCVMLMYMPTSNYYSVVFFGCLPHSFCHGLNVMSDD